MQQESLNTNQNLLLSFLIHYKNKRRIKDQFDNEVMMFFNEDFVSEIMLLISKFTHSNFGKQNKQTEKRKYKKTEIFNIKKEIEYLESNFKFNVIEFIEYGQERGKNWQYIDYQEYQKIKPEEPKQKIKFINPNNRSRYVISKR